ncbi:MAG: S41 family peptidase [Pseudomonadota bacterium]
MNYRQFPSLAAALCFIGCTQTDLASAPEPWLADYRKATEFLAENYANLDWAAERQELDLEALTATTEEALKAAATGADRQAVLQDFIESFGDPHLLLGPIENRKDSHRSEDYLALDPSQTAEVVCADIGFSIDNQPVRLDFGLDALTEGSEGPHFDAFDDLENSFGAGILTVAEKRFGYIRIPSFVTQRYPNACHVAWQTLVDNQGTTALNKRRIRDLINTDIPNQLLSDFAEHLQSFHDLQADTVLIDLTDNGGGTDWVDPLARLVGGAQLTCPLQRVPRSDAWSSMFRSMRRDVRRDLNRARTLSPSQQSILQDAIARLDVLIDETDDRCTDDQLSLARNCNRLTDAPFYACGVFGASPGQDMTELDSRNSLFKADGYELPIAPQIPRPILIVDGHTASASEIFVAMLRDDDRALVIGSKTYGAGCGYVGEDSYVTLENFQLELWAPNCQRLRADGRNEADGIAPDVSIDWAPYDAPIARLTQLLAVLK